MEHLYQRRIRFSFWSSDRRSDRLASIHRCGHRQFQREWLAGALSRSIRTPPSRSGATLGFRAFYQWQIGKIVLEPSLKAAWEHEYKYSALPITAGFAGIPGPSATFFGPAKVTTAR